MAVMLMRPVIASVLMGMVNCLCIAAALHILMCNLPHMRPLCVCVVMVIIGNFPRYLLHADHKLLGNLQPVPAPSENPVEPRPAAMPSESTVESRAVAASSENSVEPQPDPGLLAFLDADSYEEKLEVFASLEGKVDLHMLNAIAASLDLELSEGSLEEQYDTLKSCLMTLERYECNRLR